MKNIRIKIAIGILIFGSILIAGCIKNTNESINLENAVNNTANNTLKVETNSSTSQDVSQVSQDAGTVTTGKGWCVNGNKIITNEGEFIAKGVVYVNNTVLCHAVLNESKDKITIITNYYFSRDGSVKMMNSSNASNIGNSYASSSSENSDVNLTTKILNN